MASAQERREALKVVYREAMGCVRCPLSETRTTVVFGAGDADADLMFVGEAPGRDEDASGLPFVGRAGKLLESLLAGIGMERSDVFIANVLKCRPPQNRDPQPSEIAACSSFLERQLALIRPRVVCTLGNFATKLLRDDPTGISRIHGRAEERLVAGHPVRLYPIYHPAAGLRAPAVLEQLEADFARLPALLALPAANPAASAQEVPEPADESPPDAAPAAAEPPREQLDLF